MSEIGSHGPDDPLPPSIQAGGIESRSHMDLICHRQGGQLDSSVRIC
jgi:hypothetical protein